MTALIIVLVYVFTVIISLLLGKAVDPYLRPPFALVFIPIMNFTIPPIALIMIICDKIGDCVNISKLRDWYDN